MKPAKSLSYSFGLKRWNTFILLFAAIILPVFTSLGQNIAGQAKNYPKAQVKQSSFNGIILVADNMTNWLNKANAGPVVSKKPNKQASIKSQPYSYILVCKVKSQPVTKAIKRS
ncbi:MAG: hypothetical protein M3142_04935 [Bacteroidota bacterium]|nr:hypothetical protein [Bacteroidota bacterium]